MLFLVYSETTAKTIESKLGLPEYSYYFVLKEFLPTLEKIGDVKIINDPESEVDPIYEKCVEAGETCIFLSFSPPHRTTIFLKCPTIPVFAWEFDIIPDEAWDGHEGHNWVNVLKILGNAITHSQYAQKAVRRQLGSDFPIVSIPAPLWDRFERMRTATVRNNHLKPFEISLLGKIFDSRKLWELPWNLPTDNPPQVAGESPQDLPTDNPPQVTGGSPQNPPTDDPPQIAAESPQDLPTDNLPQVTGELKKSLRYRLGATRYYARHWYRDAVRDALPVPLAEQLSISKRSIMYFVRAEKHSILDHLERTIKAVKNDDDAPQVTGESKKSVRYRLDATKYYAREWYRDVVRDALPVPLAELLSISKRTILSLIGKEEQSVSASLQPSSTPEPSPALESSPAPEPLPTPELSPALESSPAPEPLPTPELSPAPTPLFAKERVELTLDGIIYTSVYNPADKRKNWEDMVSAFCTAFSEKDNATLVLKLTNCNSDDWAFAALNHVLVKMRPFKCRVVAIDGFLDDESYERLISNSTFAVNTSAGEGQCLPLMEFMSAGKPAITPRHTAMEEYIQKKNAFIIDSAIEICSWPHDTRCTFRAHRYRINWQSLTKQYIRSYKVATKNPDLYRQMSKSSIEALRDYCSEAVAIEKIRKIIEPFSKKPKMALTDSDQDVSLPSIAKDLLPQTKPNLINFPRQKSQRGTRSLKGKRFSEEESIDH